MKSNSITKQNGWNDKKGIMNEIDEQQWEKIDCSELRVTLGKSQKWKSPGIDKIPNFWLYSLNAIHDYLAFCLSYVMQNPEEAPEWLTEGTTYLLPKSEATIHPKKYRPLTCLSTTYKLLTSILTD